jgi:hypothetical protein
MNIVTAVPMTLESLVTITYLEVIMVAGSSPVADMRATKTDASSFTIVILLIF